MILGIGIDQCQISRMEALLGRYAERLEKRYFDSEVRYCRSRKNRRIARFSMLFAAKEAAAKALGTGFRQGVSISTIEVIHLPSGQPTLAFHGAALERLKTLTPKGMRAIAHLSLTDEAGLATAQVVISAIA